MTRVVHGQPVTEAEGVSPGVTVAPMDDGRAAEFVRSNERVIEEGTAPSKRLPAGESFAVGLGSGAPGGALVVRIVAALEGFGERARAVLGRRDGGPRPPGRRRRGAPRGGAGLRLRVFRREAG